MGSFDLYIKLGFEHISDFAGFDHILFLVALCAIYRIEQFKSLLILVTAFTVGHSITLGLSSIGTINIPSEIIEFLIPTTILITALHNVMSHSSGDTSSRMTKNYIVALFFGFIHGMGFSNFFKALLMGDDSILMPLLGFNIGLELGQLMIVAVIIGLAYVFLNIIKVKYRDWNVFISGAAAGLAIYLMFETKFW
ncbi:MAG: HupE/UreJ family protein [Paraglaciecola sp.]|uniref:HupE/UreJ family protein n=3 Tax=Paraglaciecola sp. TaxID=1920173 RepID=UPI0032648EC5